MVICGCVVLSSCNNSGTALKLQDPIAAETDNNHDANTTLNSISSDSKEKTIEDLLAAFQSETKTSEKYSACSKKAAEEGYPQVALLFKAASAAEKIHADNYKAVLNESGTKVSLAKPEFTVKSTIENLKNAVKGETYEASTMYPEFLKDAEAAGNQLALLSVSYAVKTKKTHRTMFENALTALEKNNAKSLSSIYYVCPTCGNTYNIIPTQPCGICMTGPEKFIKII